MISWSPHPRRGGAQRYILQRLVQFDLIWGEEIRQPVRRTTYHLGHKAIAKVRSAKVLIPPGTLGVTQTVAAGQTVLRAADQQRLVPTGQRQRARRQA